MPDPITDRRILSLGDALADASRLALQRIRSDQEHASKRLLPLLLYIEEHLFHPSLNVNRLKQACRIRDNSIAIQFHREIGQSPKAYISSRRLETAARLIITTHLKIWEIAERVGYSNLGVFSKAFNRWAGQRPNAYRRQMREIDQMKVPSDSVSPGFLRRAVTGELSAREAKWLLERLTEMYPELREVDEDSVEEQIEG